MVKVIITKGLPGSGKSTWALSLIEKKPNSYKRVNKDDLRAMIDGGKWSKDSEKLILAVRDQIILESIKRGKHVIVDDTNLAHKHETHIRQLVGKMAVVEIKDFTHVPIEKCIQNDLNRYRSVGKDVIMNMAKKYDLIPKVEREVYVRSADKKSAVICDLDGTLALLNGRNPYDASTCEGDILNEPVARILFSLQTETYYDFTIIFTSGRSDKYRAQTERWLAKHKFDYFTLHLHMRKEGDTRKDAVVKEEMFRELIDPHYNVEFVLDDRDQVVDMWRRLGLTCLQVEYGDF